MIAWDYLNHTAAYDPGTDSWRSLPRVPSREYECSPESVGLPAYVVGDYCGRLLVYAADEGIWHNVPEPNGWSFELVPTGAVVFVLGTSFESGEPRTWAYRPPTSFACAGTVRADPGDAETARTIARAFLEFRVDRAERDLAGVLTSAAQERYESGTGDLPPLLSDYIHGEILYVDGPRERAPGASASAGAAFEVGLRLFDGGERAVEETVLVSWPEQVLSGDTCPLAVSGTRTPRH